VPFAAVSLERVHSLALRTHTKVDADGTVVNFVGHDSCVM